MASPRALVEPRSKVLVIGAGIAGLAAAQALSDRHYDVTVLEARKRIGGRIDTVWPFEDVPQIAIDCGASFFHGGPGNPLKKKAESVGITSKEFDYGAGYFYDTSSGHAHMYRTNLPALLRVHLCEVTRFLGYYLGKGCRSYFAARWSVQFGCPAPTTSVGDVFDKIVKGLRGISTQQPFGAQQPFGVSLATTVGALKETGFASPLAEQSYLNLGLQSHTKPQGWVLPKGERLVIDGMRKILDPFLPGIPVHLNQPVTAIHYQAGQVRVTTTDTAYEAQAAVITCPVGVLLRDTIHFDPPLVPAYKHAMAMVDMGLLNKVVLRFDECFWPEDASLFLSTPDATTQCTWFLNLLETGCPILVGFVGGHAARQLEYADNDVVTARALQDLSRIFPSQVRELVRPPIITRWGSDPFAYGSYSRFRVGALGHERRLLSQPILDTLFLAGEATHPNDPSTLQGAYWSGMRAARQIAGT